MSLFDNAPAVQSAMPVTKIEPNKMSVVVTDDEIEKLGEQYEVKLGSMSQKMLQQVKASDAEGFGNTLNQLVVTAKGMDPAKFTKKGLVSNIRGMFGSIKERVLSEYNTVEKQIDRLIGELDKSANNQSSRIHDLEEMFDVNYQSHVGLEQAVQYGNTLIIKLKDQLTSQQSIVVTNSFDAQTIADTNSRIQRLERKVDNLQRAMLLAKQAAPEIRLLQDNARTLVEKFSDLKKITIPAWKQVFSLYIIQMEQKKGVELANAIDDATNDAFIKQADLLRQNTQEIAKAKERPAISIETLTHVQEQLIGAFDDMAQIAEQGKQARLQAAPKIKALEQQLIDRFTKAA